MTTRRFELLIAFLFVGVVLAFVVPLLLMDDGPTYEIRPEPVPIRVERREPRLRAEDRPLTYNPLDDM